MPADQPKAKSTDSATSAAEWVPIGKLKPWERNPRKNDGRPTEAVADSIRRFGFVAPVVVWQSAGRMVAGHTRLKALKSILKDDKAFTPKGAPGPGMVPVRFHEFASESEADLYALADNKLNELAEWDDAQVDKILEAYSSDDAELAGFGDEEGGRDPLEVEEIEVDDLLEARFIMQVSGPVPAQPEVLEKLREVLESIDGVSVSASYG